MLRYSCLLPALLVLTGCVQQKAFFLSPLHGTAPTYRPSVTAADSLRSAFHASGILSLGTANEEGNDNTFSADIGLSRSHSFKHFGLRYGAHLQLGNYKVQEVPTTNPGTTDPAYINAHAGNYFFGAYGIELAADVRAQLRHAEFRVIGIELTRQQEFGDYLAFRRTMPLTAATIIDKHNVFGTLGIYSELMIISKENRFGLKAGYGRAFGKRMQFYDIKYDEYDPPLQLRYFLLNASFARKRTGISLQAFSGEKGTSTQLSVHYRIFR